MKYPKTLYKYRAFSLRVVDQLCNDVMHFADPITFNDPLDTQPCLERNSDNEELSELLLRLVGDRKSQELQAAAGAIRYQGPKTVAQIEKLTGRHAASILHDARYHATNPDHQGSYDENLGRELTHRLETALLLQYDKGVLSLASRYNCPLMWSHYGDQHSGVCIGYEVPSEGLPDLHKVEYGGARTVFTSDVAEMVLRGCEDAKKRVNAAILLRKARDWRYEKEWRLIGEKGATDAPLNMTEVVFGLRCSNAVKFMVVQALERRKVKFYDIASVRGTFKLKRVPTDVNELAASYPRDYKAVRDAFSAIPEDAGLEAQADKLALQGG